MRILIRGSEGSVEPTTVDVSAIQNVSINNVSPQSEVDMVYGPCTVTVKQSKNGVEILVNHSLVHTVWK
jgi:hypothetical protein